MFRSLLAVAAATAAASAAPPPEFALIPADAAGVVHVRLAELWNNPALADYRAVLGKAGDKALAGLDEQFSPAPSTVERVTAVVRMGAGGRPQAVVIARFSKPFDPAKVRAANLPTGTADAAGGKEFFAHPSGSLAVHFPDTRTIVLGDRDSLTAALTAKPAAGGRLAEALAAVEGKPLAAVVSLKALPVQQMAGQVPPEFRPLLDAELMILTVGLDGRPAVAARLVYGSADQAIAADVAMRKGLQQLKPMLAQGRAELEKMLAGPGTPGGARPLADLPEAVLAVAGLGSLAEMDALLANPPVKRVGNTLAADLGLPAGATGSVGMTAVGVGLLLPAVQKVREAAARAQSQNNLKQIALAVHNYESANGFLPPAAIVDKKSGKRLLSWRVAVLPYIEQEALYRQFKLDEPWDSPTNLPLSKIVIRVYTDPRGTATEPGLTYYKAFVGKDVVVNGRTQPGPDALWSWTTGRNLVSISDGTSNTAMVGAFGPPVTWTKPDDFEYDPKQPLPDLFSGFSGLNVAFADGSVRYISPSVDQLNLRAMITAAGGEVVNLP